VLFLALSQGLTSGVATAAGSVAVIGVMAGLMRFSVKKLIAYGESRQLERQEDQERTLQEAALKKIIDANLLDVVETVQGAVVTLQAGQKRMERRQREMAKEVRDLRKATLPNGKNSKEIGDQVALLRDDVAAVDVKLGAHLESVDGGKG